ncbi:hypothetical protein [Nannocystis pusilla]
MTAETCHQRAQHVFEDIHLTESRHAPSGAPQRADKHVPEDI